MFFIQQKITFTASKWIKLPHILSFRRCAGLWIVSFRDNQFIMAQFTIIKTFNIWCMSFKSLVVGSLPQFWKNTLYGFSEKDF